MIMLEGPYDDVYPGYIYIYIYIYTLYIHIYAHIYINENKFYCNI